MPKFTQLGGADAFHEIKSEVKPLQPFSCLAFPFSETRKTPLKRPIFGDELVTSFCADKPQEAQFGKHIFRTPRRRTSRTDLGSPRPGVWKSNRVLPLERAETPEPLVRL